MTEPRSGAPGPLRILYGLFKAACILAGLPLTILCLMAIVGAFTANGWVRLAVGGLVGTLLPLLIIDRLLPAETERGRGLVSDGLALVYVAVPLLAVAFPGMSARRMVTEGDRLQASGWTRTADLAYWLGGAKAQRPSVKEKPIARPGTGTAAPKTTPTARKDAGPPRRDAGARADARSPDSRPGKLTPSEIFQRFAASVVYIKTERGGGTGFLIDHRGTTATNSHVIRGADSVEVKLKDGTVIRDVDLLVEDQEADLALLQLKASKLPPPLQLGDSDKVNVGEHAVAIGNPLGLEHTLTDGLISARRVYQGKRWLQISVPLSPGNSGGPLFSMQGEVIGVNTATVSIIAQNLNLAVPANELKKQIKDSYPARRSVGVSSPGSW